MTIMNLPADVRSSLQRIAERPDAKFPRDFFPEERLTQLSEAGLIEPAEYAIEENPLVGGFPYRSHYRLSLSCRDQLAVLCELHKQQAEQQRKAEAEKELAAQEKKQQERKSTRRFWISNAITFLCSGTGGLMLGSLLNAGRPFLEWLVALFH